MSNINNEVRKAGKNSNKGALRSADNMRLLNSVSITAVACYMSEQYRRRIELTRNI